MKCPFRKITKKEIKFNKEGKQSEVTIIEEYCECDERSCVAYNGFRDSCYFVINGVMPSMK